MSSVKEWATYDRAAHEALASKASKRSFEAHRASRSAKTPEEHAKAAAEHREIASMMKESTALSEQFGSGDRDDDATYFDRRDIGEHEDKASEHEAKAKGGGDDDRARDSKGRFASS